MDTSRTTRTWGRISPASLRPNSSAVQCTAPIFPTTACSMSATAQNDRIQVFKTDGTFVKEVFLNTNTLGDGSVWDMAFSKRS